MTRGYVSSQESVRASTLKRSCKKKQPEKNGTLRSCDKKCLFFISMQPLGRVEIQCPAIFSFVANKLPIPKYWNLSNKTQRTGSTSHLEKKTPIAVKSKWFWSPLSRDLFNIHVQEGARNHHHFVQCMDQALKITVFFGVEVPEPSSCASLEMKVCLPTSIDAVYFCTQKKSLTSPHHLLCA